jgi:hypothetical protein
MRYLCLIYEDETIWDRMPRAEADELYDEYFAVTDELKKSGRYLGGEPLQPTRTATTVRMRRGKLSTTDGPFAETKEQLGGYFMIEASDLNEAIKVAGKIPGARLGSIEVRPIMEVGPR